jgi:hypothetical protein
VKDETARELVRKIGEEELPVPSWTRVTMRAKFEDQFATRRAPFEALPWVQLGAYAGVGITLAALAVWAIFALA